MEKYTDQEFFYKQTPVNYDGIAKFTSIKGNTLGWNQLVQNGNFADTSNWYARQSTYTVSDNIATVTPSTEGTERGMYCLAFPVKANHKYLLSCEIKPPVASTARVSFGGAINYGFDKNISANQWSKCQGIVLNDTDRNIGFYSLIRNSLTPSQTIQFRNMMVIDLTQIGLDISSPSEFPFSLPYYDYNQGELLPFMGTGIKTTGKNLLNLNIADGTYLGLTVKKEDDGSVSLNGRTTSSGNIYLMDNTGNNFYVPNDAVLSVNVASHGEYDVKLTTLENTSVVTIGNESLSANVPKGWYKGLRLYLANGRDYNLNLKLMIAFDSTEFEPYTETTTSLPISTYFPTGMKSAGDVYDELTESKAITRVGSRAYQSGDEDNANYVTDGTTTYYPLATETETDAEDIFYKFYADGTEQILPVNGSAPTTSYIIADIEYYDSTEGDSLYRRFWLINRDGERWDLTDKEFRSFLNNPTGLGFRKTIEITRYGEKANKNNEVYDFPQPSGELLFYDTYNSTRYDKYNKFIRFLMSQPITLYYMIPVSYISGIANIFTLDCDVTEVQKTESKTDHILTSSIVFNGLGFYEGDEISINGTTDTYTLTNEGDFPVGFEITVEGSLTNPYITLSQDGELYGEAKFDSATAFNSLYLNSNDGEQNIILQQGGSVIPNPLSYQDLSISNGSIYVTFVKLAKGVSELSIGMESGSITNVNIKYSPKYRSV